MKNHRSRNRSRKFQRRLIAEQLESRRLLVSDFGDAPDGFQVDGVFRQYQTLLANGGAEHVIVEGAPFLGGVVPGGEPDGQPTVLADGDNSDGDPDEDGLRGLVGNTTGSDLVAPGEPYEAVVGLTGVGFISVFVDWNSDGDWMDSGEEIVGNEPFDTSGSTVNVVFNGAAPLDAAIGRTYLRMRVSSQSIPGPGGTAIDGEVEDYAIFLEQPPMDFGDAPDSIDPSVEVGGVNDPPDLYPTRFTNDGARHRVLPNAPFLGSTPGDVELDATTNFAATGDDETGNDDENLDDGGTIVLPIGQSLAGISIDHDGGASGGFLNGWIDRNRDGDWDDANEQFLIDVAVPAGGGATDFGSLTLPIDTAPGPTFVRLRIATETGLSPRGEAADGEVEDIRVEMTAPGLDFGDAPDSYQTTLSAGGPRHTIGGPQLSGAPDAELDANAPLDGSGDDAVGNDDEDGVVFSNGGVFAVGVPASATIHVSGVATNQANLNGWIDFNGDGDFTDSGEHFLIDEQVGYGDFTAPFTAPDTGFQGATYARFRISTDSGLAHDGPASDGEVEDYQVTIGNVSLSADKSDSLIVDQDGDGQADPGDQVRYSVVITNTGSVALNNVTYEDHFDVNTQLASTNTAGQILAHQEIDNRDLVTIGFGDLAPTQTATATFDVTIVDQVSRNFVLNQGLVSGSNFPTTVTDDPDTEPRGDATRTDVPIADLSLMKMVDDATPDVDQVVEFTIVVSNDGPDPASGVVVADLLPSEYEFVTANTTAGSYLSSNGAWTIGSLGVGQSVSLLLAARVLTDSSLVNTAEVSQSNQFDPDSTPGNGVASEDDQSSAGTGLCLTVEPLTGGGQRLIFTCASPLSLSAFVGAEDLGEFLFERYDTTVDLDQPDVLALGVADGNGVAVVHTNATGAPGQTLLFQAFEMKPENLVSNVAGFVVADERIRVEGGENIRTDAPVVSVEAARTLLPEAIQVWASANITASQLEQLGRLKLYVLDLPGDELGAAAEQTIYLDSTAAGHGWWTHSTLDPSSDKIDLLSVLVHELGHVLGLPDTESGVMQGVIAPGVRRLPKATPSVTLPLHNALLADDVDGNGFIDLRDGFLVIERVRERRTQDARTLAEEMGRRHAFDANGDNLVNVVDVFQVLDAIRDRRRESSAALGESESPRFTRAVPTNPNEEIVASHERAIADSAWMDDSESEQLFNLLAEDAEQVGGE